jgi:hypothetical protein
MQILLPDAVAVMITFKHAYQKRLMCPAGANISTRRASSP